MSSHATDRTHLTTVAYADGANLAARQSIYRFQQPQLRFADWVLEQVDWRGSETVVDVGCGNGAYVQPLGALAARVIGVDLSRGMLLEIATNPPPSARVQLAVADAQALPLRNHCADVLLATHMLYHVPDIAAAVRELRRVLRPGGVVLAATNGAPHLLELFDVLRRAVASVGGTLSPRARVFERFAAENGHAFLHPAFDEVEWRPTAATLAIPEPGPVIDYFNSMRGWVEAALPASVGWRELMSQAERIVAAHVVRDGAFRVAAVAGVFVCR